MRSDAHYGMETGRESIKSDDKCTNWTELMFAEDFRMQLPTMTEAGDEILQVLEVCEPVKEIQELIVTSNSLPVASPRPSTRSQVRQISNSNMPHYVRVNHRKIFLFLLKNDIQCVTMHVS